MISLRATYDTSLGHKQISSLKFLKRPTVAVLSVLGITFGPTYNMIYHKNLKSRILKDDITQYLSNGKPECPQVGMVQMSI